MIGLKSLQTPVGGTKLNNNFEAKAKNNFFLLFKFNLYRYSKQAGAVARLPLRCFVSSKRRARDLSLGCEISRSALRDDKSFPQAGVVTMIARQPSRAWSATAINHRPNKHYPFLGLISCNIYSSDQPEVVLIHSRLAPTVRNPLLRKRFRLGVLSERMLQYI